MTHAGKNAVILASALILIATFNLFVAQGALSGINSKADLAKPAEISLVTLTANDCPDCFDINAVVASIKSAPTKIMAEKEFDYTSDEAKELIKKYGIRAIPALIISGEVEKPNIKSQFQELGTLVDGAIIFSKAPPVYINLADGKAVGRVSATVITANSCAKCRNISELLVSLKANGVSIVSENSFDYASGEGKALVSKYNITRVPALFFSKDLGAYGAITDSWGNLGTIESDGTYVFRQAIPPYVDVLTNKARGLVSVTNIVDASCKECYAVSQHKGALLNLGIVPSEDATYDISSFKGKDMVSKYNITQVPTIIISSDAVIYTGFSDVWKTVGTKELDGTFVFRALEVMGAYKDLQTNKTVQKGN